MKKSYFQMLTVALGIIFTASYIFAAGEKHDRGAFTYSFENKEIIDIETVSGNCVVKPSTDSEIRLILSYDYYPSCFEKNIDERGRKLRIRERFSGSCSGNSDWVLEVPENTIIRFSTASGSFSVEDCRGVFNVDTASGDIEIINSSGEFQLNTASGDIDAEEVVIVGESEFETASGDVSVKVASAPEYDLTIGSASGDAEIDYNGNPLNGYFEFTARVDKGEINSPRKFDSEEIFTKRSHPRNQKYMRKSFTEGSGGPEIIIKTASGKASLKL